MTLRILGLLALGLVAIAGCQSTQSGAAAMTAPEPAVTTASYSGDSRLGDVTDAGVRAGKPGDDELPEGARMLGDNEDPTALTTADDGKVLCKRMKVTGTRISTQRVCKTRKMWKEYDDQARRGVRRQLERNQAGTCPECPFQ